MSEHKTNSVGDIWDQIKIWVHDKLGNIFIFLQKSWFQLIVIATLANIILELFTSPDPNIAELGLISLRALRVWFFGALLLLVIWPLGQRLIDIDLWIYYYVWIRWIFPVVGNWVYKGEERIYHQYIRESFAYERKGRWECPALIKREHLMRKRFWPDWNYAIVMLKNIGTLQVRVDQQRVENKDSKLWSMSINLANESFGIYNHNGKAFLQKIFGSSAGKPLMEKLSTEFFAISKADARIGMVKSWDEQGSNTIPLRWASGGFLPIVVYKERYWAMLFFRDIFPVGLNVANGASEDRQEYKNINKLIGREFCEETILLLSDLQQNYPIRQACFTVDTVYPEAASPIAPFLSAEYTEIHTKLRQESDSLRLILTGSNEGRMIFPIRTPFELDIKYHSLDIRDFEALKCHNVIFTINPMEMGVEVIWLCNFDLNENEYLLDGELTLSHRVLIRRPVVLVSMDFLHNQYLRNSRSLGDMIPHRDSKILPIVPQGEFVLFDYDVIARKRRIQTLNAALDSPSRIRNRKNLEWERDIYKGWIDKYEIAFNQAMQGDLAHEDFRTLCPVTWKTLELIFDHKIQFQRPQ